MLRAQEHGLGCLQLGRCVGTEPQNGHGKPRAGLRLPKPLPAGLPGSAGRGQSTQTATLK